MINGELTHKRRPICRAMVGGGRTSQIGYIRRSTVLLSISAKKICFC